MAADEGCEAPFLLAAAVPLDREPPGGFGPATVHCQQPVGHYPHKPHLAPDPSNPGHVLWWWGDGTWQDPYRETGWGVADDAPEKCASEFRLVPAPGAGDVETTLCYLYKGHYPDTAHRAPDPHRRYHVYTWRGGDGEQIYGVRREGLLEDPAHRWE